MIGGCSRKCRKEETSAAEDAVNEPTAPRNAASEEELKCILEELDMAELARCHLKVAKDELLKVKVFALSKALREISKIIA